MLELATAQARPPNRTRGLLTDTKIRTARPKARRYKLYDGHGLFLFISPGGGKWWRFRYKLQHRQHLLSLGTYPEISLRDARAQRDAALGLLANGVDPLAHRAQAQQTQARCQAETFEVVAREWFANQASGWAASYSSKVLRRLECYLFPFLGSRPIREIAAPELLSVLRKIEERGIPETAHRVLGNCRDLFAYAMASGRVEADKDPTRRLAKALKPTQQGHFAAEAATHPEKLREILRAIAGYKGTLVVATALRLAPLVFVRPGELRQARWADMDLDAAQWEFPLSKTRTPIKKKRYHIVPLARQAVAYLRELRPVTGSSPYVFPSLRSKDRPMSDNALNAALRRLGIEQDELVVHGFRAIARTILAERLGFRPDIIEHQLGHTVRDPNGEAYNRTKFLAERRQMMQQWADYLDTMGSVGHGHSTKRH